MQNLSKRKRRWTILLLICMALGALLIVFDCDAILDLWDLYEGTKSDPSVNTWVDDFLNGWVDLSEVLFFCGLAGVIAAATGLMHLWARKVMWGVSCILCGIICNGYLILDTLGLFFLPRGTPVRPIGWVGLVVYISVFAAIVGVVLAVISFAKKERPILGAVGFVLAVSPSFISQLLFELAVAMRALQVAQ